jgi:hypothetical protein
MEVVSALASRQSASAPMTMPPTMPPTSNSELRRPASADVSVRPPISAPPPPPPHQAAREMGGRIALATRRKARCPGKQHSLKQPAVPPPYLKDLGNCCGRAPRERTGSLKMNGCNATGKHRPHAAASLQEGKTVYAGGSTSKGWEALWTNRCCRRRKEASRGRCRR